MVFGHSILISTNYTYFTIKLCFCRPFWLLKLLLRYKTGSYSLKLGAIIHPKCN